MNRVALLTECQSYSPSRSYEEHLVSVGGNTGNNAYISALMDIFNAPYINYRDLDRCLNEDKYDTYIVGNLSWIVENTPIPDYYYNAFKKITNKGKRFVPISIGTQVFDYKLDFVYHPKTLSMLKEISEQALIACRGYYTAEILNKNGITNITVVGCPSLFHRKDPNFTLNKRNNLRKNAFISTGITPWPNKNMALGTLKRYFNYIIKNDIDFIEQANTNWIDNITKTDDKYKELINNYLSKRGKLFFNIDDWREYSKELDFSFGGRFHGNVIPILEGVPALFITIDARTKELCDYFNLPSIDIKKFNFEYTLDELYTLADYTDFNKNYKQLYQRFKDFANKNNLEI